MFIVLKENIHKINITSEVEENEVNGDNKNPPTLIDKDFVEAILNVDTNNEMMNLSMYKKYNI